MYFPSDHHVLPRSRGGKKTLPICRDCHDAIHATYDTQQLEKSALVTVEALQADPTLARVFAFLAKQSPQTRTTTKTAKQKRRRGC